ncbi:unnamed protein product [Schistosoma mattheei]|uniref:Uncharacterized protein n=1 Tax=Schistosoma mattheei TaxID=31246 RepID=A0A3P8FZS7_9TREM|nr:unnamed protein product [Schistosoma mattheei]
MSRSDRYPFVGFALLGRMNSSFVNEAIRSSGRFINILS